jgi:uncharacterized membrane protein
MFEALTPLRNDLLSLAISAGLLLTYRIYLQWRLHRDPTYTIQAINNLARDAWVQSVMASGDKDVLAVQTLRNSTMVSTFLASTAILLIIGTLTLSEQGDKLSSVWHSLNRYGAVRRELWIVKLIFLLVDFFVAFFSFSLSIRMYNHVGYLINVPGSLSGHANNPSYVARLLNRGGRYYSIGMRSYYLSVPLVFWLFGPEFMLLATLVLIVVLYYEDRAPQA